MKDYLNKELNYTEYIANCLTDYLNKQLNYTEYIANCLNKQEYDSMVYNKHISENSETIQNIFKKLDKFKLEFIEIKDGVPIFKYTNIIFKSIYNFKNIDIDIIEITKFILKELKDNKITYYKNEIFNYDIINYQNDIFIKLKI
jgi:hypothetical protein